MKTYLLMPSGDKMNETGYEFNASFDEDAVQQSLQYMSEKQWKSAKLFRSDPKGKIEIAELPKDKLTATMSEK